MLPIQDLSFCFGLLFIQRWLVDSVRGCSINHTYAYHCATARCHSYLLPPSAAPCSTLQHLPAPCSTLQHLAAHNGVKLALPILLIDMDSGEDPPPSRDEVVLNEGAWSEPLLPPPSQLALAWRNRRYFIVVLVPLLLCPIPIIINNPVRFYQSVKLVMVQIFPK